MAATINGMGNETRYYSDGKVRTAAQLETEFKKSRLVAGQPTAGDEYDTALNEWLSTHAEFTNKDQRSVSVSTTTFAVIFGAAALIGMIALVTGSFIAFIICLIVGGFVGFTAAAIVMMLTSPSTRR